MPEIKTELVPGSGTLRQRHFYPINEVPRSPLFYRRDGEGVALGVEEGQDEHLARLVHDAAVHHLDAPLFQLPTNQLVGVPSDAVLADVQRHECRVPFLRDRRRISRGRARRPAEPPFAVAIVCRAAPSWFVVMLHHFYSTSGVCPSLLPVWEGLHGRAVLSGHSSG